MNGILPSWRSPLRGKHGHGKGNTVSGGGGHCLWRGLRLSKKGGNPGLVTFRDSPRKRFRSPWFSCSGRKPPFREVEAPFMRRNLPFMDASDRMEAGHRKGHFKAKQATQVIFFWGVTQVCFFFFTLVTGPRRSLSLTSIGSYLRLIDSCITRDAGGHGGRAGGD